MATVLAAKPKTLSQALRGEGFSRRFNGSRCPAGMRQPVWGLTGKLRDALRIRPKDVHLNGSSKVALKLNSRTALVVEIRSGLTSSMLITDKRTHVSVLDGVVLKLLGEFGLEDAVVLRATLGARPTVAVAVDEEDMLLVQWMSMS